MGITMNLKTLVFRFLTRFLLPVAIIAAAVYGFMQLKGSRPKAPAKTVTEQVWGVSSHQVALRDIAPEVTLYGAVEASETVQLSSTVNAFVNQVSIGRGDRVSKGQQIIELDDRELRLTLRPTKGEPRRC